LGDRVLLLGPPQPDHPHRMFVGDYQMIRHAMVPRPAGPGESVAESLHQPALRPNRRCRFSTVTE
jgi:hypothetical protein